MTERYQNELAKRAHSTLPFEDEKIVSGVIRTIMDEMYRIRHRGGSIVYPESLSFREVGQVKRILGRYHPGLLRRIDAITPIRLEDRVGTEFLLEKKAEGGD